MPDPRFTPGFLTGSAARAIAADHAQGADAKNQLDSLATKIDDTFPASITSGSLGLHAWTEQAFSTDGTRYTKSGGRTGTITYMPARMPDGSTLTVFPQYVWLKRAVVSDTYGPVYEILINPVGTLVTAYSLTPAQLGYAAGTQYIDMATVTLPDTRFYSLDFNYNVEIQVVSPAYYAGGYGHTLSFVPSVGSLLSYLGNPIYVVDFNVFLADGILYFTISPSVIVQALTAPCTFTVRHTDKQPLLPNSGLSYVRTEGRLSVSTYGN